MPTLKTKAEIIAALTQCGTLSYADMVDFIFSVYFVPPGTGQTATAFKVRDTNNDILLQPYYNYDAGTDEVTIQDDRLIGQTDPMVYGSDQTNEFERTSEGGNMSIDSATGTITITGYQLAPNKHISITTTY